MYGFRAAALMVLAMYTKALQWAKPPETAGLSLALHTGVPSWVDPAPRGGPTLRDGDLKAVPPAVAASPRRRIKMDQAEFERQMQMAQAQQAGGGIGIVGGIIYLAILV